MSLLRKPTKAKDKRTYYSVDGTSQEDDYFGSNLKEVFFQSKGYSIGASTKWMYRNKQGKLFQINVNDLPAPIKMTLMLLENL